MDTFLQKMLETSPYWGPFLVAFAMTLAFCKWLINKLISNGLTDSIKLQALATEKIGDKLDTLPDKVGAAVAFKILEHSTRRNND